MKITGIESEDKERERERDREIGVLSAYLASSS
jgi:hypothetical protein